MWICPVCNRKNEENLLCCPACSFDASSNYENFNTLNSLAEGTAAISRRKESAIESTIKSSNRIDWPNVTAVAQCLWHTVVLYRDGRTAAFGDNDMDQVRSLRMEPYHGNRRRRLSHRNRIYAGASRGWNGRCCWPPWNQQKANLALCIRMDEYYSDCSRRQSYGRSEI